MTDDDFMSALRELSEIQPNAVVLVTKKEFSKLSTADIQLTMSSPEPASMADMYHMKFLGMTLPDLRAAARERFTELELSEEQVSDVYEESKDQHKSSIWAKQRVGRLTASSIGKILKTTISDNPALSYVKQICFSTTHGKNAKVPALAYGRRNEEFALNDYKSEQLMLHDNLTMNSAGLKIKQDAQYAAATPDGIRHCDCCGTGLIEVKCPYSLRNDKDMVIDFIGKKNCYISFENGSMKLNENHDYYYQVQYQLAIFKEAKFCDFVVWTKKDFSCQRIYPNKEIQDLLLAKAENYFYEIAAPQLMAHFFVQPLVVVGN